MSTREPIYLPDGATGGRLPIQVSVIRTRYGDDLVAVYGTDQPAVIDADRIDEAINLLRIVEERPMVLPSLIEALEMLRTEEETTK